MQQSASTHLTLAAAADRQAQAQATVLASTLYRIEAHDPQGNLKWAEDFHNLVVDAGLNDLLTQYFKGVGYTAAWYVGLMGATPVVDHEDTLAAHTGWTECVAYTEAARQALMLGSVAAKVVSNTASKAVFTINADHTTIGGAFVTQTAAKSPSSGHNSGVLYGGGAFTAGNKVLDTDDTLSITITLQAAAG